VKKKNTGAEFIKLGVALTGLRIDNFPAEVL